MGTDPVTMETDKADNSCSETTIYRPAVNNKNTEKVDLDKDKRGSSSSEEFMNISDETAEGVKIDNQLAGIMINGIIAEGRNNVETQERRRRGDYIDDGATAHTSRYGQESKYEQEPSPQEKAAEMIRRAEKAKARIMEVSGNQNLSCDMLHSVLIDEKYSAVALHVDEVTRDRIWQNKYVDFSRLLPNDRNDDEEEEEILQMVNRKGAPAMGPC